MNRWLHIVARSGLLIAITGSLVTLPLDADARRKKRGQKKTAPVAPAPAPAPAPTPAPDFTKAADTNEPTDKLLERAKGFYKQLEFESVIPLANAVIARADVTPDQKLDAYLMQASSLAIIGDPIEAEKPFRMLLRGRPDYDMPVQTPPKIIAVFRKVQVEEKAMAEQLRAIEVDRTIKSLKLIGKHPGEAAGGFPLVYAYRLQDPGAAVDSMRVMYRRQGETSYSALALRRDPEGVWRGVLAGEWTASEEGFTIEFYLTTGGPLGELLKDGSAKAPQALAVAPGTVDRATPPPLPLWSFLTTAGLAGALGVASATTGVHFTLTQGSSKDLSAQSGLIDGGELREIRTNGEALATTTNVLLIGTGLVALAAAVMAPFTNWTGRTLDESPEVAE